MLSVQRKYVIFALCKKNDGYENTKRIHSSVALARSCLATRLWHSLFAPFWIGCPEQQTEQSDIDVCVEMDPKPFVRLHVKDYLERLLGCSVDVIRKHQHMNSFLLNQIDKEGIYVF